MTELLLIRHARSTANATGVLAGRTRGVHLDDAGKAQARELADFLASVPLTSIYSSPLERCMETAKAVSSHHPKLTIYKDNQLLEMDYGQWSGQKLSALAKKKEWATIQSNPSQFRFPGGESFLEMNARVNTAIDEIFLESSKGKARKIVAVCAHADVIKAITAHSLGLHLDAFQRIVVDPASVTILRQVGRSRFVVAQNVRASGIVGSLGLRESAAILGGGDGSSHKRIR
ncbi:MAG: MSMEG_4193 family putative phosphomutase [Actinomycetes bacterium]